MQRLRHTAPPGKTAARHFSSASVSTRPAGWTGRWIAMGNLFLRTRGPRRIELGGGVPKLLPPSPFPLGTQIESGGRVTGPDTKREPVPCETGCGSDGAWKAWMAA